MSHTHWLNVIRHPQQPINRRNATWEQFSDPAWQNANDDIHPTLGPQQIAAGIPALRLHPGQPVLVCHSGYRRTQRGAELVGDHLRSCMPVELRELPALREADIVWPAVMTRAEYDNPERPATLAFDRIVTAIATDDPAIVRGGRASIAAQVRALSDLLSHARYTNHVWVTHAPLMPFIEMGIVDRLPPEGWSATRAITFGMRDFGAGFSAQLPAPSQ